MFSMLQRHTILAALWVCPFLISLPSQAELFFVWAKEAEVFEQQRRAGTLRRGEIVTGQIQPGATAWVTLKRGDQTFTVRREHLRTHLDIKQYYAKRIRKAETTIRRLDERLADTVNQIDQRQLALLQLDRDSVIAFKLPVTRPSVIQSTGPAAAVTQYHYVDKLPRNQARRLRKQLTKEIKRLKSEKSGITKPLAEAIRRLANDEHQLEGMNERFERYQQTPKLYRVDPYVVTADVAPLFSGTVRKGFLATGTVVLGQRQAADTDWLVVQHAGKRYASATEFYMSYSAWRKQQLEGDALREFTMGRLEVETTSLSGRIRVFDLVERQLDYDSRIEGQYMPLADLTAIRFGPLTLYEVQRPLGAIEVVERSPARKVLKQWRKDREALEQELRKRDGRLDELEREQLNAEHRNARIEKSFEAFFEALEAR